MAGELVRRGTYEALPVAAFEHLEALSAEAEWLANQKSAQTRRAYANDVRQFLAFCRIQTSDELRRVQRPHLIAWRESLLRAGFGKRSICRKLSAVASLFDYLCEKQRVDHNPVDGVKRPPMSRQGETPAISPKEARKLLDAPAADTLRGLRDRAILSVLLHDGPRRSEVASMRVKDFYRDTGYDSLRFQGKGGKVRAHSTHPETAKRLEVYLTAAGHWTDREGPLFRPVRNNRTKELEKPLTADQIARIVKKYARQVGLQVGISAHSMRATFATTALENGCELAHVQDALGHADPSTTRMYDKRKLKPEKSPAFHTNY